MLFIENSLLPQLKPKHTMIMDNVKFHLQTRIGKAIELTGTKITFRPLYSPDLNPIESIWAKIKNALQRSGRRTARNFEKCLKIAFKEIT